MTDRISYRIWDFAGYWLCEFVFRMWRGKLQWMPGLGLIYRMGCWCCGRGTDAGVRCGALVPNEKFGGENEPMYVWASWAKHP